MDEERKYLSRSKLDSIVQLPWRITVKVWTHTWSCRPQKNGFQDFSTIIFSHFQRRSEGNWADWWRELLLGYSVQEQTTSVVVRAVKRIYGKESIKS